MAARNPHPGPRSEGPPFIGRPLRDVWAHFTAELGDAMGERFGGVTPATNQVMLLIDLEGTRVAELSRRAGVTKQSMSEAVANLEARGLVERRPDPADGRAKLVVLTEEGQRALREGRKVVQAMHDRWTAVLGEEAMGQLVELLTVLAHRLDEDG